MFITFQLQTSTVMLRQFNMKTTQLKLCVALLCFVCKLNVRGESSSKCFAKICSSNPSNQIRGCDIDGAGCGHYGASRDGGKTHKGIDIVCEACSCVFAPFPAKVLRQASPYGCEKDPQHCEKNYNTGIYMEGTGPWADYKVKMFYVSKEVDDEQNVGEGSFIGTVQDRAAASPGMTNHVHVELYKDGSIVDPTPYVC